MNHLFTKWKDKATQYVDVRLQLMKLGMIERTSTVLGNIMLGFIFLFLSLACLVFLGVGLLEIFSAMLNSRVGGSLLTMGIYVLLLGVIFLARKGIVNALAGIFIRILTEGDDDDVDHRKPKGRNVEVEGEDD